jgi:hypothetical protein
MSVLTRLASAKPYAHFSGDPKLVLRFFRGKMLQLPPDVQKFVDRREHKYKPMCLYAYDGCYYPYITVIGCRPAGPDTVR